MELTRKRRTEKENLKERKKPRMPTKQGRSMKKKEQEGKMRNKRPKHARENQEKFAH